jgi:hypothetical protein
MNQSFMRKDVIDDKTGVIDKIRRHLAEFSADPYDADDLFR